MATTPKGIDNMVTNVRDSIGALSSAVTHHIPTDPGVPTAVHVHTNNSEMSVWTTTDAQKSDGTRLTDLEDSGVLWNNVSTSGTADYFAGDSKLITGVKISGLSQSASSGITYSVTQKKGRG